MKSELTDDSFDTKFLYRYRKFSDEALNAITDGKLYFSSPKNYNDPFDSTHYIDYINLLSTVGRDLDDMDNYLKKTYGASRFELSLDLRMISLTSKNYNCRTEYYKDMLKKEEELENIVFDNVKTICFSSEYLSTRMWSHYSDSHTGFLLMYSKEDLQNAKIYNENDEIVTQKIVLDAVNYSNFFPDAGELYYYALPKYIKTGKVLGCGCYLNRLFFSKTKDWEYEHEWRVCTYTRNLANTNDAKYLGVYPVAVFVGSRMCEEHRKKIYKLAKSRGIPTFEVFVNTDSPQIKLNFCELKYKKEELRDCLYST